MKHLKLLCFLGMTCYLAACSGPFQEKQTYLQQYGYQGGRGQGYRMYPAQVSQEAHVCVPGKISGRIIRLRPETFSLYMEPGLAVEVQTLDKGLVHVHLGPLWLLERREADLKPGDEVTMQVFCSELAGKERLLAAEVVHKDHKLLLRDSQGTPYWAAWR